LKKRKKGTTLKPLKKPCDKCAKALSCTIERELDMSSLHWRYYSPSGRRSPLPKKARECKLYYLWLSKLADPKCKHSTQDHVSRQGVSYSARVKSDDDGDLADDSYILDKIIWQAPLTPLLSALGNTRTESSYHEGKKINLNSLSEIENKILHLYHIEGLTYREIVRVVNGGCNPKTAVHLTVKAVERQLSKVRRKLGGFFTT